MTRDASSNSLLHYGPQTPNVGVQNLVALHGVLERTIAIIDLEILWKAKHISKSAPHLATSMKSVLPKE